MDIDILEQIQDKAANFPKKLRSKNYYLISKSGCTDRLMEKAQKENVRLIALENMLA